MDISDYLLKKQVSCWPRKDHALRMATLLPSVSYRSGCFSCTGLALLLDLSERLSLEPTDVSDGPRFSPESRGYLYGLLSLWTYAPSLRSGAVMSLI